MKPTVSVIVVSFNGLQYLKKNLKSIHTQIYPHVETVLVDNNSTDGSVEYVSKHFPKVRIIQNPTNNGFAKANNQAVKEANGEYIFLLNNDTELFPDTIQQLLECYKPTTIITAHQIPTRTPHEKGKMGAGMDIFGYSYTHIDTTQTKLFFADGAALFMKRTDFLALKGFDEELYMFQEDIDLSWRARILGYQILPCWRAKLYHYFGGTAPAEFDTEETYVSSSFRRYLNERNTIRNILKNYSALTCIPILLTLALFHIVEMLVLIFTGNGKIAICYLKAYLWNITHLHSTIRLRRFVQANRKVSDIEVMRDMYWNYTKLTHFLKLGLPKFR